MVVLVTGSSKGIGRETIKKFASEGYDVVIHYNNSEREALSLQKEIEEYNVKSMVIKCDMSIEEDIKYMYKKVIDNFGTIDVLVNNAGVAIDTTFEDKTVENFRYTLSVNLIGPFVLSRLVGDIMYENLSDSRKRELAQRAFGDKFDLTNELGIKEGILAELIKDYGKGTATYKAAVTGDTVGDTRKDVVGPALDIVIKTMSTTANTLAPMIGNFTLF